MQTISDIIKFNVVCTSSTIPRLCELLTAKLRSQVTGELTKKILLFGSSFPKCAVYDVVTEKITTVNIEQKFCIKCTLQMNGENRVLCAGDSNQIFIFDFFANIVSYVTVEGLKLAYSIIQLHDKRIVIHNRTSIIVCDSRTLKTTQVLKLENVDPNEPHYHGYILENTNLLQLKNGLIACTTNHSIQLYNPTNFTVQHEIPDATPRKRIINQLSNGYLAVAFKHDVKIYDNEYKVVTTLSSKKVACMTEFDGKLVIASQTNHVTLWDMKDWSLVKDLRFFDTFYTLVPVENKLILIGALIHVYSEGGVGKNIKSNLADHGVLLTEYGKTEWTYGNRLRKSPVITEIIHSQKKEMKCLLS
jgi:hypothetical protein